jgi:hypothetical protein
MAFLLSGRQGEKSFLVVLSLSVKPDTVRLIEKQLDACWQDNKGLLGE